MARVLLDSASALEAGLQELRRLDPILARVLAEGAVPVLRKRDPGLASLVQIIVSQQLSVASAAAIWKRMTTAFPDVTAERLAIATEDELRRAGLSGPKIRTVWAIAAAVMDGRLRLDSLHEREADLARAELTAVSGIGPWTADVYLLFCLGHPDTFPAGDLALQEAARIAFALEARPNAKALAAMAETWRPWRGVAAKLLWAYYSRVKSREGAPIAVIDALETTGGREP